MDLPFSGTKEGTTGAKAAAPRYTALAAKPPRLHAFRPPSARVEEANNGVVRGEITAGGCTTVVLAHVCTVVRYLYHAPYFAIVKYGYTRVLH